MNNRIINEGCMGMDVYVDENGTQTTVSEPPNQETLLCPLCHCKPGCNTNPNIQCHLCKNPTPTSYHTADPKPLKPEGERTKAEEWAACYSALFAQLNPVMEENRRLKDGLADPTPLIEALHALRPKDTYRVDAQGGYFLGVWDAVAIVRDFYGSASAYDGERRGAIFASTAGANPAAPANSPIARMNAFKIGTPVTDSPEDIATARAVNITADKCIDALLNAKNEGEI